MLKHEYLNQTKGEKGDSGDQGTSSSYEADEYGEGFEGREPGFERRSKMVYRYEDSSTSSTGSW